MKKIIVLSLSFLMCALCTQAQLLWKVEGNGLKKPSYIMGTYHLAQVSFADSVAGLKSALAEAEQVYGEMNMQDEMNAGNMQKMQAAMMLPDGQTIDGLLSADELARLNEFMRTYLGADFTNPMLAPMKQMTPAALSTQFQVLLAMQVEGGFNPQAQFDTYFQQEALKAGKTVGGFETIDFQINTLLKGSTLERQVEQLMCLIDNVDYMKSTIERTVKAFYEQDLDTIEQISEEKLHNSCDLTSSEEDALVYSRNVAWSKLLPDIMSKHSTFVAVGAAHLPGERGLLSLLKKTGYTVSPVK